MTGAAERSPRRGGDHKTFWDGLAVAIAPDRMLSGPEAAGLTAAALERLARLDHVPLSPQAEHLRRVARQVAQANRGHGDVPGQDPAEASPACGSAWISTAKAADQLRLSPRQVRRLAAQGDLGQTRTDRGRLLISPDEVAALAAARSTA